MDPTDSTEVSRGFLSDGGQGSDVDDGNDSVVFSPTERLADAVSGLCDACGALAGGGDEMSSPCLSASSVASGESPCASLNSAMQFGGRTIER